MSDLFSIVRKNDNPSGRIIWSEDQIAFIIKEYNEHHSTTKIADMFKTSPETIRNVLRKNGQKVLSIEELKKIDYPRNSNYFQTIDSPDKAYWLGFLYADGYIGRGSEIRIGLSSKDEAHLKKLLDAIGATNSKIHHSEKITLDKVFYQSYISIRDKKMCEDLRDKGCVNKKSLILTFPMEKISKNLYSHFVRGYFDGDGSIHFTQCGQAKKPNYRISFYGTKDMLEHIRAILGKDKLSLEKKNSIYCLSINGNKQLEKILSFIYKDSYDEIELTRKRQIYTNFLLQRIGGEPTQVGCE